MTEIITVICTMLSTFLGVVVSSKLTAYRIEQLEKKVEKHNNTIDRTYALEKQMSLIDEKIKVVNHRLDGCEKPKGGCK